MHVCVFDCSICQRRSVDLFQALKSDYFLNKPYPTPNHLLPMIGNTKKEIMDQCKPSLKRKIDGESGMFIYIYIYLHVYVRFKDLYPSVIHPINMIIRLIYLTVHSSKENNRFHTFL
jgi:hypothetical protein